MERLYSLKSNYALPSWAYQHQLFLKHINNTREIIGTREITQHRYSIAIYMSSRGDSDVAANSTDSERTTQAPLQLAQKPHTGPPRPTSRRPVGRVFWTAACAHPASCASSVTYHARRGEALSPVQSRTVKGAAVGIAAAARSRPRQAIALSRAL